MIDREKVEVAAREAAAAFTESMGGHAGGKIVLTEFTN